VNPSCLAASGNPATIFYQNCHNHPNLIMKTPCQILCACLLASSAHAEFRTWTRGDGKTAELDLIAVTDAGGEKTGEFKMRNGRTVTLKQSVLAEADGKLLAEWKPAAASEPSVFDRTLDGNLLKLQGKSLKALKDFEKPAKYYLFYYTASWCGPCHRFTPSLVKFYNKYKPANHDFELILITSDKDEKSMEKYAAEMNMPWPQLKLPKAGTFNQEFMQTVSAIPNLVLTDLQGKILKATDEGKTYVGPGVVMNHLETLLKK
jgi:thiol-disulfide isomerase/thioredoxin